MVTLKWLEDLGKNLDRLAGREIREKVMAGSENLSSESSPEKFGEWFKGAVERLDELTGEETRGQVLMDSCPEVFPPRTDPGASRDVYGDWRPRRPH